jgi:hypothetical protein
MASSITLPVRLAAVALAFGLTGAAAAPALAAPLPPIELNCVSGDCAIRLDASAAPAPLRDAAGAVLELLPFGTNGAVSIDEDVTVRLPIGDITLTNASLEIERAADGSIERLHGTADMPFPTFGLLDDVGIASPARAAVGLDFGRNLAATGLDLVPDRRYLFFDADTAMDVAAHTPGGEREFSIALQPGQRLQLVIDTEEAAAYLNGQVTLSGTDQLALLGGALESTPVGEYLPEVIPVRERTQFGLSGKFSKDLTESYIALSGAYGIDGGSLPASLGIEAQPLRVDGTLRLSRDGALIDGVLGSRIQPELVFDGDARIVAFLPFPGGARQGYVRLGTDLEAPLIKVAAGGTAEVGGAGYLLEGYLASPLRAGELRGRVEGEVPDVAATVGPVMEKAAGAMGEAGGAVGSAVGKAGAAVGSAAGGAGDAVGSAVGSASGAVGPVVGKAAEAVGSAVEKAGRAAAPVLGRAAGAVGSAVDRAGAFVGPVVGKAARSVGQGWNLLGGWLESGKAGLGN